MSNRRHLAGPAELLGRAVSRNIAADPVPVARLVTAAHLLAHLEHPPADASLVAVAVARAQAEQQLREAAWDIARSVPAFLVTQAISALAGSGDETARAAAKAFEDIRAQAEGLEPEAD